MQCSKAFDVLILKISDILYRRRPCKFSRLSIKATTDGTVALKLQGDTSIVLGGVCRYATAALLISLRAYRTVFCLGRYRSHCDLTIANKTIPIPNVHFELSISLSILVRTAFPHPHGHNIFEFVADPDSSLITEILSYYTLKFTISVCL